MKEGWDRQTYRQRDRDRQTNKDRDTLNFSVPTRADEKTGVRQVQTLRSWPATLTSRTLNSTSTGTLLCLRFEWLATSPDNILNVTLEEMGGEGREGGGGERSSTELWDSGNETVWRDVWHSQNLQFEAPPTYRVRYCRETGVHRGRERGRGGGGGGVGERGRRKEGII